MSGNGIILKAWKGKAKLTEICIFQHCTWKCIIFFSPWFPGTFSTIQFRFSCNSGQFYSRFLALTLIATLTVSPEYSGKKRHASKITIKHARDFSVFIFGRFSKTGAIHFHFKNFLLGRDCSSAWAKNFLQLSLHVWKIKCWRTL